MYLHLSQQNTVNTSEIIGIFDLDTSTLSKKTREFLARAQKENRVINTTDDLPKSYVLTKEKVFICQPTAVTLKKRVDQINSEHKTFQKRKNKWP